MKRLILLTFILSFNSYAENSRSPAVLDGSCNLNIPLTTKSIIDGKEIVKDREIQDVLKEQCKEVRKCMNSAGDDEIDDLKKLEAVACNNSLSAVTTKTPGAVIKDENFDGNRRAKNKDDSEAQNLKKETSTTTPK
jgi:hypothetical protein